MRNVIIFAILFLTGCKILPAQTSPASAEVDQLKSMVTTQQKTLEHQQSLIEALQKALAEQRALLEQAVPQVAPSFCVKLRPNAPHSRRKRPL